MRRRLVLILLIGAALVLGACGGDASAFLEYGNARELLLARV